MLQGDRARGGRILAPVRGVRGFGAGRGVGGDSGPGAGCVGIRGPGVRWDGDSDPGVRWELFGVRWKIFYLFAVFSPFG